MQERHADTYREEAHELLSELESSLLELEGSPGDMELVGRIFRAMHTIKGSGAMFGFDAIAAFTHEVETVFDNVRHGTLQVTRDLIDLTLKARDCIRLMLDEPDNNASEEMAAAILSSLRALASGGDESETVQWETAEAVHEEKAAAVPDEEGSQTYRIRFTPARHLFRTGTNPLPLLNELHSLGECSVTTYFGAIPPLEAIDPESCYAKWDAILTTSQGLNAVKDVFIFVENDAEVNIGTIDEDASGEGEVKKLGEILVERGDVGRQDVERVLQDRKPIGELLVESGVTTSAKVASALSEQEHVREVREKRKAEEAVSSIRVSAEKLDKLVDLVGELVTIQARLTEKAANGKDPDLVLVAEEVERLTNELRDNTMSIRMLPIGSTFSRFKRLVRDLSQELGKEIELYTEGAETELDKTVIERLNDPLVHIIRNAVDHGIEEPSVREELGKPRVGTIVLSAKHSGGNVLIDITDDGKGLHKEKLRQKAVEKGLVSPDAEMSEKEIFSLIFAPGFSTSSAVTSVSGRGVGMDVVKKTVDGLRGSVDVSSEEGTGTSVTLKLPLTLAIIDGLLVEIGKQHFVLPLSLVKECVELTREDVERAHGRHIANVRGEIVPYVRLREKFGISGDLPAIEQIVIADIQRASIGLVVDNVIGEHQTVIKSLGRIYRNVRGVSGSTILGDGTVALIMDVPGLVDGAQTYEITTNN